MKFGSEKYKLNFNFEPAEFQIANVQKTRYYTVYNESKEFTTGMKTCELTIM